MCTFLFYYATPSVDFFITISYRYQNSLPWMYFMFSSLHFLLLLTPHLLHPCKQPFLYSRPLLPLLFIFPISHCLRLSLPNTAAASVYLSPHYTAAAFPFPFLLPTLSTHPFSNASCFTASSLPSLPTLSSLLSSSLLCRGSSLPLSVFQPPPASRATISSVLPLLLDLSTILLDLQLLSAFIAYLLLFFY